MTTQTVESMPIQDETSFFDILRQDVGFDVVPSNVDLEDKHRFTKLEISPAQKIHVSALLQHAPAAVAEGMMAQAYIVKFPEGLPHVLTTLKQGGYSTVLREHGKIVGSASLYPFAAQAAVLGAFTAMSVVSGQYFLAQINHQLDMMQKKLDDVLQFLYGDKKSELIAELKFAQYTYENYSLIMDNDAQRIATISSLQEGKKVAMKDIEFYIEDLQRIVDNHKKDNWAKVTEEAFKEKQCLDLAIQLYVMTTVLEVYYSQNQNQDYLNYLEKDVSTYVNKCEKRILSSFSTLKGRIDSQKTWPLGKNDKLDPRKEIEELLEQLNQGEESELEKSLHVVLNISEQPTEYYLNQSGEVYVKVS